MILICVLILVTALAIAGLDFLWLGFVMKDFNLKQLSDIGRIADGDFQILYAPAVATYFLMAIGIVVFVLPQVREFSWTGTFLMGALLGLVIYGVFDMTNMAILKNYPWPFALADMAWGTFVFGMVTLITKFAAEKIIS